MREFTACCKDTKTGMQMVLSGATYNMACDYLMKKGFYCYDSFKNENGIVTITFSTPARRTFVYDEERGYLLGD